MRQRLPDRRLTITDRVDWAGRTYLVGVGFDADGVVREIFVDGVKGGSDEEAILGDAGVLVSLLLQSGWSVERLADHVGREGVLPGRPAASILGLALGRARDIERENQTAVGEAYAARAGRT